MADLTRDEINAMWFSASMIAMQHGLVQHEEFARLILEAQRPKGKMLQSCLACRIDRTEADISLGPFDKGDPRCGICGGHLVLTKSEE